MTGRFGCWHYGLTHGKQEKPGWVADPITGERVRGTRARMRLYAADMMLLGHFIRPNGVPSATGFRARRINDENIGISRRTS